MKRLELSLVESEIKILLEALMEKEAEMAKLCESSDDEDEIADVGNDLIELRLFLNSVREQAVSVFGAAVLDFDRHSL